MLAEHMVLLLTSTEVLAPGARRVARQPSVCDGAAPVMEHVQPGSAALTDHDTPVPPGSRSLRLRPVAAPVPAADPLDSVILKPMGKPACTAVGSVTEALSDTAALESVSAGGHEKFTAVEAVAVTEGALVAEREALLV